MILEESIYIFDSHYVRIVFSKMSDVTCTFIKINIIADECIEAGINTHVYNSVG